VDALTLLGQVKLKQGKYGEAETALRPALRANEENRPDSWQRYNCQSLLGASLAGQKNFAEAEPLLLSAYSALGQRAPAIPAEEQSSLEEARKAILQLYQAWPKPDKVAEWRRSAVAPVTFARSR
jgi:tetratricopeptide (TPR) repeat protein